MAFYLPEADNFEDLTNEEVYPLLLCKKLGRIPHNGTPEHDPSDAENMFAEVAQLLMPTFDVRREVLLEDICEVDTQVLVASLNKKHNSRVHQIPEITRRAKAKLQSRIGKKRCDFLFFNPQSHALKGAIEVDGEYHKKNPQRSFDYSKNLIFCGLQVPLLRLYSDDVVQAYKLSPPSCYAQIKSLLNTAKENWNTFNKNKTITNMQLHLR